MPVAKHLDLDVTWCLQVSLQEDSVIAKRRLCLPSRSLYRLRQTGRIPNDPHPLATTPRRRLDQDRIPESRRRTHGPPLIHVTEVNCKERGHTRRLDQGLRTELRAHDLDRFWRRADPGQSCVDDPSGEFGVLGQKSVPGVDGVRPGLFRRPQDRIDVQIGFGGSRAGKVYTMIRLDHMWLGRIGIRVDGHRFDVHPTAGAEHAASDLTAVCDQESSDHRPVERTDGNHFRSWDVITMSSYPWS